MAAKPPIALDSPCPCGNPRHYQDCCQALIEQRRQAQTAEQLMRSRYTAHVVNAIDYLLDTWAPELQAQLDLQQIRQWAEESQWLGLEIVTTHAGLAQDCQGQVEFIAHYRQHGQLYQHRERSHFRRGPLITTQQSSTDPSTNCSSRPQTEQPWYFVDGEAIESNPKEQKTGRNQPCPCGSGRKFKRCCGP